MATGSPPPPEHNADKPLDLQGNGQSVGMSAEGELEGSAFNLFGASVGM